MSPKSKDHNAGILDQTFCSCSTLPVVIVVTLALWRERAHTHTHTHTHTQLTLFYDVWCSTLFKDPQFPKDFVFSAKCLPEAV